MIIGHNFLAVQNPFIHNKLLNETKLFVKFQVHSFILLEISFLKGQKRVVLGNWVLLKDYILQLVMLDDLNKLKMVQCLYLKARGRLAGWATGLWPERPP